MALPPDPITLTVTAPARLDKALATAAGQAGLPLSRSRISALIAEGAVTDPDGRAVDEPAAKVKAGAVFVLRAPAPADPDPKPEPIPLNVIHEDDDLIVVNKPAGMVVHPAPGAETGTLVNALLHHCGDSLSGIGGVRRPGIVHRIDKDTSGLLVVAKSDAAHSGLAAQFAAHSIDRRYLAIAWGKPDRALPRLGIIDGVRFDTSGQIIVDAPLGRDGADRKKIAVRPDGRRALSRFRVAEAFGPALASLLECRLETGRTHQIRVHAAHIGHPLIGDPVYGMPRKISAEAAGEHLSTALRTFPRQALHAVHLGFEHPITGEWMEFQSQLPPDMNEILSLLRRNTSTVR